MSYTTASVGIAQAPKHVFDTCATEIAPQTDTPGQRAFCALASAITELDSRIDQLGKRLTGAMCYRGEPVPGNADSSKAPRPTESELVTTVNSQRSRIDEIIGRVTVITNSIDI